jgi:raffinose/stachyose/melibiose transport system substrate-binding protein
MRPRHERASTIPPSPASEPFGPRIDRRTLIKAAGYGAIATGVPFLAGGCGSKNSIQLHETKPEVVGYFDKLASDFNKMKTGVTVSHDSTSNPIAQFVRGKPSDIYCDNYNLTASIFVARGVLRNLAGMPQAKTIDPNVQALVTQYAQYKNDTSVLPFSIAAEGVIYNRALFDKAGVTIPTTWSEFLAVCDKLQSKNIVPIYSTYKDTWTTQQGLFDYVSGGLIDVADFFKKLNSQGSNISANSPVSFEKDFKGAVGKMVELLPHMNKDAASRGYSDGNTAFANGAAAMYLQGPWAVGQILLVNPKLKLGTFPLPVTDNAADTKCRVNLDLAVWIPTQTSKYDAAVKFLAYLMQPKVVNAYNKANLAFSPLKNAPPVTDPRISGLDPYVKAGKFYQGAGTYVPNVIPIGNYLQEMVITKNTKTFLQKLDSDYRRLAIRTSA